MRLLLLLILNLQSFKHQQCKNIDCIKEKVEAIDSINSFDSETFDDADLYYDSDRKVQEAFSLKNIAVVDLVKYKSNGEFKKITVSFDAQQSNLSSNYYVLEDKLIFVKKILKSYSVSKESESFDSSKFQLIVNEYYFFDDKLIKWESSLDRKYLSESEEEKKILNDFNIYSEYSED
ncbi:hypothetical protein [Ekhidna sp.]